MERKGENALKYNYTVTIDFCKLYKYDWEKHLSVIGSPMYREFSISAAVKINARSFVIIPRLFLQRAFKKKKCVKDPYGPIVLHY